MAQLDPIGDFRVKSEPFKPQKLLDFPLHPLPFTGTDEYHLNYLVGGIALVSAALQPSLETLSLGLSPLQMDDRDLPPEPDAYKIRSPNDPREDMSVYMRSLEDTDDVDTPAVLFKYLYVVIEPIAVAIQEKVSRIMNLIRSINVIYRSGKTTDHDEISEGLSHSPTASMFSDLLTKLLDATTVIQLKRAYLMILVPFLQIYLAPVRTTAWMKDGLQSDLLMKKIANILSNGKIPVKYSSVTEEAYRKLIEWYAVTKTYNYTMAKLAGVIRSKKDEMHISIFNLICGPMRCYAMGTIGLIDRAQNLEKVPIRAVCNALKYPMFLQERDHISEFMNKYYKEAVEVDVKYSYLFARTAQPKTLAMLAISKTPMTAFAALICMGPPPDNPLTDSHWRVNLGKFDYKNHTDFVANVLYLLDKADTGKLNELPTLSETPHGEQAAFTRVAKDYLAKVEKYKQSQTGQDNRPGQEASSQLQHYISALFKGRVARPPSTGGEEDAGQQDDGEEDDGDTPDSDMFG